MGAPRGGRQRRILVVSASMGTGHVHAGHELARRLTERGHVAREVDLLALPKWQGRALRGFYTALVRFAPGAYDVAIRAWARWPWFFERVTAAGAKSYERGLLAEITGWRPDVVVATFELAAQALGRLRRRGAFSVPLVTYVSDPGAHPYWISPDVDRHLTVLPETAAALAAMGARGVVSTGPLVNPRFAAMPAGGAARGRWGLPADKPVTLVSAGSWGVGGISRCVRHLGADGDIVVVVLCGHNERLRRHLATRASVVTVGWTEDVPELMAAATVLVDNAGGLTCLEALVAGLPVVIYRPLPGHGRYNAAMLARAGIAALPAGPAQLRAAVRRLATSTTDRTKVIDRGRAKVTGDPAEIVLAVAGGR